MSTKPRFRLIKDVILSILDDVEDEILLSDVKDEVNKRIPTIYAFDKKELTKNTSYIGNIARNNGFKTYRKRITERQLVKMDGENVWVTKCRNLTMLRRDKDANN
tara:strand:+ start:841 stop:1155 length:315 start_codon:yes stop_codon:yes gene_type:complete